MLIEAIDIWIERKVICCLQESPYFSILAYADISTQEEISICGRWLAIGKPEEQLLTVLRIHSTDVVTIVEALHSILQQKQIDLRNFIGQGYDGASSFAGKTS